MPNLPRKLKHDAIVEALLEVRFESTEVVKEILVGRLSEQAPWSGFESARLAVADIPLPMRLSDMDLRYQPLFEMREVGGNRVVKIGTNVLSFHIVRRYCGWQELQPQLHHAIDVLRAKVPDFKATRLGLRYINAFSVEKHNVSRLTDLALSVAVAGAALTTPFNLNFVVATGDADTRAMVRVAHPEFLQGSKLPEGTTTFLDVDVYTPAGFNSNDATRLKAWVDRAHEKEKQSFFDLLGPERIAALRED